MLKDKKNSVLEMIPGCSFIQDEAQLGWEISSDFLQQMLE